MGTNGSESRPDCLSRFVSDVTEQAEDLCHIQDHVIRVIANLDIDVEWFSGYDDPERAKFELPSIVKMFLYKEVSGFNQSETARRLKGAGYVYMRLDLSGPLSQQVISHNWMNRFTRVERQAIETASERIWELCEEHNIRGKGAPALEPGDVDLAAGVGEEQIREAVGRATELGFTEFTADRASNAKYPLEAFFERQGYLNLTKAGTTTPRRRFARLSDRKEVPHGSTHNRTMKKVGNPEPQTDFTDYGSGRSPPDWERIRDKILPQFHDGIEKQLDEIAGRDRDGIREPVSAAIDITTFNFWPSPFEKENVPRDEEPVISNSGREVYPKEDYPEMVSGFKDANKKHTERGYKFATLTVVAADTPIVLGIEPVRDVRWWEKEDDSVDAVGTSRKEIVEGLVEQAEQHVDLHKMFCDREFDIHGVRDLLDRRNIQYVIGKAKRSNADSANVEDIIEDPVYDSRIEHVELHHEDRTHKVSIIYLPGGDYSLFTVNGWVDADRANALTKQYRQRWTIENQYKSIKENFLPKTATKDYRIRFLYFVIGVILHNVWRLSNFLLRDEVEADLGESPPLGAAEIVELVGFCLFEPD